MIASEFDKTNRIKLKHRMEKKKMNKSLLHEDIIHNQHFFFVVLIVCLAILCNSQSYANDDDIYDWTPRFYPDHEYQEGRNICIGIVISDDGLYREFSVGRSEADWSNPAVLFENKKFSKEDAFAKIDSYRGNTHIKLFLFIVADACLPDVEISYEYSLYDMHIPGNFPEDPYYLSVLGIKYTPTGEECTEITEETCTAMNLTEFYSWEYDDDDETPNDDDDFETNDDDDNNNDGKCGGCAYTGDGVSFSLAFLMLLIGAFAWSRSRKVK